ncbi:hypothetical protein [Fulvivirga lutea]|uniref:Uncharacterized protein n=1 Tax=Fulvivirga lutea TaxID=2810512 RepID=A0A974WMT4_9BACT|nr:hypothetical protein [Fulvivirga lutea]QSE99170.1 hypothetical protein JR347_08795 [Fulvivirga lutea]
MDKEESLSQYETPDSRWSLFNVNSFKEYESKYIIKGKFHGQVPTDVVEAYKSAEHIMAQAYYHYPLLDEAANKLLRIMEMAVKMRCLEIDIELKFKVKDKKEKKKDLNRLINDLDKKEVFKNPGRHLHVARGLRNYSMHPEKNSLHGTLSLNIYEQMVNLLNELFLPDSYFKEKSELLQSLEVKTNELKNGLFVLNINNKSFLIQGAKPVSVDKVNGNWVSFWVAHPIFKEFKKLVEGKVLDPPFFFALKEVDFINSFQLVGKLLNETSMSICRSNNQTDNSIYEKFLNEQARMTHELFEPYKMLINSKIGTELMRFRYLNCWH